MKQYPFHTAYTQIRELYGLTLFPDEFESIGLIAWNKIGNKDYRWYKFQAVPEQTPDGAWYVDLPCNAEMIEAVTADYEDYQKTTPTTIAGNNQNGWIESYVETRKYNTSFYYSSGKFVKYTQQDNRLWLADRFNVVNVLYRGVLVDEDGLPVLNEKELDAVASFCMFVDTRKRAAVSRDPGLWQTVPYWENNWRRLCTQARVPEYVNQNEMDEILNVAASWDRKRFGKTFKPIK